MPPLTVESLKVWLVARLAALRAIEPSLIDVRERFVSYGLDSIGAGQLVADLAEFVGRPLPPTLVWDAPTIEALATRVLGEPAVTDGPARSEPRRGGVPEPIAIVGVACRFPGSPDPEAFWRLLREGIDAITEVPGDRWDVASLYDSDPNATGKVNTRWGGFLDRVDGFDPQFFGISPREAVQMDPQQRLALELAWEALEDAGIPPSTLAGSRTGVFVGALFTDYALLHDRAGAGAVTTHTSTGGAACIISNRVSYVLGLEGPSMTVDTACSSSLVAIHLACQSLRSGESDAALAGGVNLMLVPETTMGFSRLGAMSPDGRCRAFSAGGNGYVRSEGAGVLVLKRHSDALRDGDPIYALVRGSAVNNDGASNGLTAPNPRAQQNVIRDACQAAGLSPREIHYAEAHGTGTPLGDPIEASGLGAVYGAGRTEPLLIGSAKTNVGHLEAAAGMAGVIKVALAMKHDRLPPSLHFAAPNPRIDFAGLHLQVVTELRPWPTADGAPRRAGVSSFGYGGTNGHVVLESVPRLLPAPPALPEGGEPQTPRAPRRAAWIFSGQGSQWVGMGRRLVLAEPAFRAALAECDRALAPHLGWSVFDELLAGAPRALPERIDVMWPTLFAFQVALAGLLRASGLAPAAVMGHSIGEVAAAHVAGALSLEDAARVIAGQARLVQRTVGSGSMLLVGLGWDEAEQLAAASEGRVHAAIAASPVSTVLAGSPDSLGALAATLSRRGIFVRPVNTGAPVHGPQMAFLEAELPPLLSGLRPGPASVPIVSALTGKPIRGEELDAAYWARQLRQPVRFAQGTAALLAERYEILLELAPHPIVKHSLEESVRALGVGVAVVAALHRGEEEPRDLGAAITALGGARPPEPDDDRLRILPVSGQGEAAHREAAARLADLVERSGGASLDDVCYTSWARRPHHRVRGAVIGRGRAEVTDGLRALAEGREHPAVKVATVPIGGAPKVVFVFPGQGSQWLGMGQRLLAAEPAFRRAMVECDAAILREAGFSVLAQIAADEGRSRLAEIDVVQPLLFAMEVCLAALWRSWGIEPDCVVGHSMGEVAAAHVAGILSLEDAAKVICRRSKLLRRVSGKGAMGLVELTLSDAEKALAGYEDRLSVAVSNAPRSTVLSGDPAALEAVLGALEKRGVFCRRVKVDVASHSPQVDGLRDDLSAALSDLRPREARVAMVSTVTGEPVAGPELDAGYWVRNLRAPVLFSGVTQRLMTEGHGLFVELSPHPILLPAVEENLREVKREGLAIASGRRNTDEQRTMLEALATIHVQGHGAAWTGEAPRGASCVSLPVYPWQRERFWLEPSAGADAPRGQRSEGGHPLLGRSHFTSSLHVDEHIWERTLSLADLGYLEDHRVRDEVVFPAAGYAEMALAAAGHEYGDQRIVVEGLAFERMLPLGKDADRSVQVAVVESGGHRAKLVVQAYDDDAGRWQSYAKSTVREAGEDPAQITEPIRDTMDRCPREISAVEHYAGMDARHIQYGPAFQGVERMWVGSEEAVARITLPAAAGSGAPYRVHPALLDACFQACYALLDEGRDTYVPAEIAQIQWRADPGRQAWVRISAVATTSTQTSKTMDIEVLDDDGRLVLTVQGLRLERLPDLAAADPFAGCAYTIDWRSKPLDEERLSARAPSAGTWVVLTDTTGTGAAVAEQLRARGNVCIEVAAGARFEQRGPDVYAIDPSRPEDYQRLFRQVVNAEASFRGVVHCWNLDATPWEGTTAATLLQDVRRGSLSALHLVQELVWQSFRDAPRLILVTRGAQAVDEFAAELSVAQSALWGLGRTIAMEQPDLGCTRIDLDPTPNPDEAAWILRELLAGDGEDQIALRDERRLVARLQRGDLAPLAPPTFDANATYLITGGLGGLGLAAARWLVSSGVKHLLLVGRHDPSEQARAAISAMVEKGAQVRACRADVARLADVEAALDYLDGNMPRLKGIIHAAGVLEDRTLQEMTEEQFTRAIRPKILGAWNLHAATTGMPLDFFVMYSSIAALLGPPGQGNYSAANTFLDALAHARAAHGLPGLSLQWGTFSEVGLAAAQENRGLRMAHRGIESFTPDEGVELLSRLIGAPRGEIGLLRMSVRQWTEFYPRAASVPFLSRLRRAEDQAGAVKPGGRFLDTLRSVSRVERRPTLEQHVTECLARVLGVAQQRIEAQATFRSYGMDSLMSLEVRNRLEASLGLRLSAALLFTYPTTAALVEHLLGELHLATPLAEESLDGFHSGDQQAAPSEADEADAIARLNARVNAIEDYLK